MELYVQKLWDRNDKGRNKKMIDDNFLEFSMNKICTFLLWVLGWKIDIEGNLSDKNVIAVMPHTSYWDGFIGFLAMRKLEINYKTLSAEWLFFFPMKYIMKYLMRASPVKKGALSSLRASINLLKENDKVSLIVCPEGQLKATDDWGMGFYYIAKKANVNIAFAIFDYEVKKISIVEYTNIDTMSENDILITIKRLCNQYPCYGKHNNEFKLPKLKNNDSKRV